MKKIIYTSIVIFLINITQIFGNRDSLVNALLQFEPTEESIKLIIKSVPRIGYSSTEGRQLIAEGLQMSKEIEYKRGHAKLTYYKAISEYLKGEFPLALITVDQCLAYYQNEYLPYDLFSSKSLKGMIYRNSKDYFAAQQLFMETIDELEQFLPEFEPYDHVDIVDMKDRLASLYGDLSALFMNIEEVDKSIEYQKKAVAIYNEIDFPKGKAIGLNNLARRYELIGKFEAANQLLLESYQIKKSLKHERSIAIAELNLANNYVLQGDKTQTDHYLRLCESKIRALKEPSLLANFHEISGQNAHNQGRFVEANEYYKEALNVFNKHNINENKGDLLNNMYQNLKTLGRNSEALSIHELYMEEVIKSKEENISKKVAVEHSKWENGRLLDELNSTHDIEKAGFEDRIGILSTTKNLLGLGAILLLLLSSLLYFGFRNKKRYNEELKHKNTLIEKALKDKDILLREIHHRVKNNLQVVSSLLNLQSNYIEDDAALEAINEGKNRVSSMALIHQNLYGEGNLTGISTQRYFEDLIDNLLDSYNVDQNIQVIKDIQSVNIDVETMVPIGLIVNELVSNALKHAFEDDSKGILSFSFREGEGVLILEIEDNGRGMTADEFFNSDSFGNRLIQAFKQKLGAELTISGDNGTKIKILISKYKLAA